MLRTWPLVGATTLLALLAIACGGNGEGTPSAQDEAQPTEQTPAASPSLEPTPMTYAERPELTIDPEKKYTAIIETEKGTFRIQLRPDLAIQTVNSFIFLAREGYYDGVTFHRVIRDDPSKPDFMAQGGDPTGTGSGGPGYTLPAEFSDTPYVRGTVGMARTADPDSGGSQFFITYNDQYQPALNGQYTVFGEITEGIEVVESLTPRDPATDPSAPPGDAIISIEIVEG